MIITIIINNSNGDKTSLLATHFFPFLDFLGLKDFP